MKPAGRPSFLHLVAGSFCLVWLLLAPAQAATVADLYEVSIPVTTTRDAAFVDALKAVLVKVSGRRDAAARVGSAANDPRRHVQKFGFTADNVLQVGFDSVAIDRLLTQADLPIWGRERPGTLVLLNVAATDGSNYWVDSAGNSIEREALTRTARLRGLPIVWPDMTSQDRAQLTGDAASTDPATLLRIAERYNANAVLVGSGRPDGAGGLNVRWTLASDAEPSSANGSMEEGIHLAADTFAKIYSASGTTLGSIAINVAGIGNLAAYAGALNYLEGMTLVRSVAVEQLQGDNVRFTLAVRGDAATLRRALALDRKLVPVDAVEAAQPADRLQLRYQPL